MDILIDSLTFGLNYVMRKWIKARGNVEEMKRQRGEYMNERVQDMHCLREGDEVSTHA